jgi:two-component system cell cycle response regulator
LTRPRTPHGRDDIEKRPARLGPRLAAPIGEIKVATSARLRIGLRIAAALAAAGFALFTAHAGFGFGGAKLDFFANNYLYDSLVSGAAFACLARGLAVREDRAAWLFFAAGLAFNAAGEIYYSFAFGDNGNPPTPSIADALYLSYYPCIYVGLVLLVRRRLDRFSRSTWMDGAIAAATTAGLVATFTLGPIIKATPGDPAAVATVLAYPLGDLLLLAIVVGVFALAGWRPGRAWLLLGLALIAGSIADTLYAYLNATESYNVGTLLDALWPASTLMIACAAWQRRAASRTLTLEGMRLLVVPGLFAAAALGLLIFAGVHHVLAEALALAGLAVLLVIVRAAWTFRENLRLLEEVRADAITDALTGLGNRRRLVTDLSRGVAQATRERPLLLLMFDLNGFKLYNDSFGHMAGDVLLSHLGRNLAEAVAARGAAYRLGGDEFCVLLRADPNEARPLVAAATTALSSSGDGFAVSAAVGQVLIPQEAETSMVALRLADDRMYGHKGGGRTSSARQQAHDVLLGVLRERQPELHEHLAQVGRLALAVGRRMKMQGEQLDELLRAADLHDVGKAAIPDEILNKPGPLSEREWGFMRRHTIIGERILSAAPALGPVAALVRSSHERWDGAGYPDGLAAEAIPLGARVICVCDAFHAMISERSYAPVTMEEDALAELQRNSGTQFDPTVVDAFIAEWREQRARGLDPLSEEPQGDDPAMAADGEGSPEGGERPSTDAAPRARIASGYSAP